VSDALEIAAAIGRRLAQEAIWHEDRCNWIGPRGEVGAVRGSVHAPLGPNLYGGTAGLALVLAHLGAATGEPELQRTALGAIRHAFSAADRIPPRVRLGLYTGLPGVALAASRVAAALDDAEAQGRAAALVGGVELDSSEAEHDLIAGRAGGIIGLLALPGDGGERAVELADVLGRELIRAGRRTGVGRTWPSPSIPASGDLTGLAHGASGIGLALLELHRASGEGDYREAGLAAFAYERELFDTEWENWPDLRLPRGPWSGTGARFSIAWCHGAPGIALARLRAYELLGDPASLADATVALATTEAAVRKDLFSSPRDWSPCHGLTGIAEVLRWGDAVLGEAWSGDRALPAAVADAGWERIEARERPWPCGTPGSEAPGLMLGLAGIALFYLRLADPAVPSALLLRPTASA